MYNITHFLSRLPKQRKIVKPRLNGYTRDKWLINIIINNTS